MSQAAETLIAQDKHPNVVITGVSTGIGKATAKLLVEQGFRVFGSVRKQTDAEALRTELGANFVPLLFDVSDQVAIDAAKQQLDEALQDQGLCAVINNAGIGVSGPLQHLSLEALQQQFDINTFGALRVIQAFLPRLGAQRPQQYPAGKIINISSVAGLFASPMMGAYSMSKAALQMMTDALRRELSIYDIDAVCIQPGAVATAIINKTDNIDPAFMETDYRNILAGFDQRLAQSAKNAIPAEQLAQAVLETLLAPAPPTAQIVAKRVDLIQSWVDMPARDLDQLLAGKYKQMVDAE